jgi:hypothetical protein
MQPPQVHRASWLVALQSGAQLVPTGHPVASRFFGGRGDQEIATSVGAEGIVPGPGLDYVSRPTAMT